MNPLLNTLHPYPFEKLATLKQGIEANPSLKHIALSIGEPKHTPPPFVIDSLINNIARIDKYPSTKGLIELRQSMATWLTQRFKLNALLDSD